MQNFQELKQLQKKRFDHEHQQVIFSYTIDKEGGTLDYSFELTSDLKCYQGVE